MENLNKTQVIEHIAKHELFIETLTERGLDDLDFHDISVTSIKNALELAYEAGKNAGK